MKKTYHKQEKKRGIISILSLSIAILIGVAIFLKLPVQKRINQIFNYELDKNLEQIDITHITNNIFPEYEKYEDISNHINSIQGHQLIKEKNFIDALNNIKGESSKDFYNRGTTKLFWGYYQAFENTFSGVQLAQSILNDALHDLETAEKIKIHNKLDTQIDKNRQSIKDIQKIVNIKYCYGEDQYIIKELQTFQKDIQEIFEILQQEYIAFKRIEEAINSFFGTECTEKINEGIQTTRKNLQGLKGILKGYHYGFSNSLIQKINNPNMCINYQQEDITPFIQNAKQVLKEFKNIHKGNAQVFENIDANSIAYLCQETSDDDNLQQEKTQDALDELTQSLNEKLQEDNSTGGESGEQENGDEEGENKGNQEGNEEGGEEQGGEQKNGEQDIGPNNGEAQYKEFLNEKEQELIKQTQQKNEERIQEMEGIKTKGMYDPEKYINQLFKDFYGNDGDFKNLDKEYSTGGSSNIREQNR